MSQHKRSCKGILYIQTRDNLAKWSKALVLGTSMEVCGSKSLSCQYYIIIFFKSQYAIKAIELANASAFATL